MDFFVRFFPMKKARKNPQKNPPHNSPRTSFGQIPPGSLQKSFLEILLEILQAIRGVAMLLVVCNVKSRDFFWSEGVFVSQQRASGFPVSPGEVLGASREVRETSGEPLVCSYKIHSERGSREVTEELPGNFGGILGSSGTFRKLGRA